MLGQTLKGLGIAEEKLDDALEAINDLIEKQIEEAVKGLKNKNGELIAKLKQAKREDSPDTSDLEDQIEALKSQLEKTVKESTRKIQQQEKELVEAKKGYESESAAVARLVIDRGLTDALIQSGADEKHLPILREYHRSKVKVVQDGDERRAVYEAADGEKPVADYMKAWLESDGKPYAKAPAHQGGPIVNRSAPGPQTGKKLSLVEFQSLEAKEQSKFFADGGALIQE